MPYDPKVGQDRSERPSGDKSFMEHYEKDRRSIFMGNLPLHADDILIHSLASLCGNVVSIDLRNTPHSNGGRKKPRALHLIPQLTVLDPNVYAFVEFSRPDAPDEAVRQFVSLTLVYVTSSDLNLLTCVEWDFRGGLYLAS